MMPKPKIYRERNPFARDYPWRARLDGLSWPCRTWQDALKKTAVHVDAKGTDRPNRSEEGCPLCGGLDGSHGLVHTRHGNGGGSNGLCPNRPIRDYPPRVGPVGPAGDSGAATGRPMGSRHE